MKNKLSAIPDKMVLRLGITLPIWSWIPGEEQVHCYHVGFSVELADKAYMLFRMKKMKFVVKGFDVHSPHAVIVQDTSGNKREHIVLHNACRLNKSFPSTGGTRYHPTSSYSFDKEDVERTYFPQLVVFLDFVEKFHLTDEIDISVALGTLIGNGYGVLPSPKVFENLVEPVKSLGEGSSTRSKKSLHSFITAEVESWSEKVQKLRKKRDSKKDE